MSRPRSSSRSRSSNRSQSSNRPRSSKTPNRDSEPPPPLPLLRQMTVSDTLLKELVENSELRTRMDTLMEGMSGQYALEEGERPFHVTLYDHNQEGFKSDLKEDKQSIYYRWNKEGSIQEAFHMTLNHTDNEMHHNRTGVHRDKNGALHIRLKDGRGRKGTLCRILINLIGNVYQITVCLTTATKYMSPVANRIAEILVEYYESTNRRAAISNHGKGKGRANGQNEICRRD